MEGFVYIYRAPGSRNQYYNHAPHYFS